MNRLYLSGLIAGLSAAAVWAQGPLVSQAEIREQVERAREEAARVREQVEAMRFDLDFDLKLEPMLLAQTINDKVNEKINQKIGERFEHRPMISFGRVNDSYNRGLDALDHRDYERALRDFDQYYKATVDKKDMRAEGALYWKAYTLHKLGRRDEALSALALLEKTYPSSRWLNDARALQLEVKQATGQGVSPESQTDEDLKLLAIQGLMNSGDADRVVPLLEKLLADPKATPRLKSKALFVLGQSRSPKAGEVIAKYAKGGGNPDVQLKAVEYLGIYGTPQNKQVLADVYGSTSDPALKRAVLRAYMIAKDKDKLLAAAKSESNVDLRREAIRSLGSLGAQAELAQLYNGESNVEVKRTIIQSMAGRREKSPMLLASMYAGENDKKLKTEMLHSLRSQQGAKELIDIARKEKDPSLKQEAVRELTHINSKEAQDYLMELLNK